MESSFPKGPTPSEVLSRIEAHWNEILKKLRMSPCKKGTTLAERISYVLQRLKEDQHVQDAEHQFVSVVCEVVGQECRKELLHIIKEVQHKTPSQITEEWNLSPVITSQKEYGATIQVTSKQATRYTSRSCWPCTNSICFWTIAIALLLLLALGALVAMAALTFTSTSQSKEYWVQEGDTVLLSMINSLWYKEVVVTETVEEGDSNHLIDAWLVPCDSLEERSQHLSFRSRRLFLYYETFLLGEQPGETPIYLLAGSQIIYSFLISTNVTLSTKPEFFIFDNKISFQSFIYGKMEGVKSAIYHKRLAVGTPQNPALTELSYTVKHNGYYFMTGYSEPGISYQFNATEHVLYLNTSDYKGRYPTCQFSSGRTCSFVTNSSFLGSNEEYCLIAHINQQYSEVPPSTHIRVETIKRYSILLLPGVVAIISAIVLVLLVFVIAIFALYRKGRSQGYTRIE